MNATTELQEKLRKFGGSIDGIPDTKEHIVTLSKSLSLEAHELLLAKLRSSREFYKRILSEERRKKHPSSYRYEDAETHIMKYNSQGKVLNELLEARKNSN